MKDKNRNNKNKRSEPDEKIELKQMRATVRRLKKKLEQQEAQCERLMAERDELIRQRDLLQDQFDCISHADFWLITKPFRWILDKIKFGASHIPPFRTIGKLFHSIHDNGMRETARKIRNHRMSRKHARKQRKTDLCKISVSRRHEEESTVFGKDVTFSILVPLYNTPVNFLNEMIDSVIGQTYSQWELCLADGSDDDYAKTSAEAKIRAGKDSRIKYRKLEKNLGISGNTNACIEMASGNYIALFDHDDILHPSALYEMMKAICEQNADMMYTDEITFSGTTKNSYCPHFKPDFSPDQLRSYNYICHFTAFSAELLKEVGGFRKEFDGSQDYDMILRLTEHAKRIVHIPGIYYFWRSHPGSVASGLSAKPYTVAAAKKALAEHLNRVGLNGTVLDSRIPTTYRIRYQLEEKPLISIIIPNMDHVSILRQCIESVENLTTYRNYEILIVENNSKKRETFAYYERVCKQYSNIRIVKWEGPFNYSAINNFAVKSAKGKYLVLLNNDIKIITPGWLEEMLMFNQRSDVGAVGMMLYYPDDTVQHAGVILGIGGIAGHSHKYFRRNDYGYMSRMSIAQNLSAVTAACMMVRTDVFCEVEGLDEKFAVAFNDVDFCMKIRKAGYLIVFTPYAEAYHYESKSRGLEDTPEKQERFRSEVERFRDKWGDVLAKGDPYYNVNLTLEREDFGWG